MAPPTTDDGLPGGSDAGSSPVQVDDEIDLRELFGLLWRRKLLITCVALAFAAAGLGIATVLPKKYESSVVFSPVSDDPAASRMSGLAGIGSQLGGLASLAGVSLSGSERKAELLAILQSQSLSANFISSNQLLPVLFADDWNSEKGQWKASYGKKSPTLWKGIQYFKSRVRKVTTDNKSGISILTIRWSDPAIAASWANSLMAMANDYSRSRAIRQAERNVDYLNDQLLKTNVVAVQSSISALLESEIKQIMLARGNDEYAFRIIDPAIAPEKAAFPDRALWTGLGLLLGCALSMAYVLLRRS
jgi:uncharacterized protein involved in exopolysaccharide biosynthesis